jgi:hypothetical protein
MQILQEWGWQFPHKVHLLENRFNSEQHRPANRSPLQSRRRLDGTILVLAEVGKSTRNVTEM